MNVAFDLPAVMVFRRGDKEVHIPIVVIFGPDSTVARPSPIVPSVLSIHSVLAKRITCRRNWVAPYSLKAHLGRDFVTVPWH